MNLFRCALLSSLFFLFQKLPAQGFQTVFPGLSGQELIDSVASHFRPDSVLDYAHARDTLYARVLSMDDDSLHCIYSDHALWLDLTQDPTQYVFQNGGTNGMNTEHAYPQAKGASEGNARSDMHHLYPTRIAVNEARGNSPYAEIPDAQTQKWFIRNQVFTSIPAANRDAYSESNSAAFEPREAVKGDLARSVFYFYTMYRAQANAADPEYFDLQRPTLCQWMQQDPADSAELRKTWRIAPYQAGKPNPFVIDCTLASRCWCPGVPPNCLVDTGEPTDLRGLQLWPNPAREGFFVKTGLDRAAEFGLTDVWGKKLQSEKSPNGEAYFRTTHLPPGLYFVEARSGLVRQREKILLLD